MVEYYPSWFICLDSNFPPFSTLLLARRPSVISFWPSAYSRCCYFCFCVLAFPLYVLILGSEMARLFFPVSRRHIHFFLSCAVRFSVLPYFFSSFLGWFRGVPPRFVFPLHGVMFRLGPTFYFVALTRAR